MAAVIAALKIPALVIHGADDPVILAAHGEDTAQSIPGAELLIVPGLGHDFTNPPGRSISRQSAILSPRSRPGSGRARSVGSRRIAPEILVLR